MDHRRTISASWLCSREVDHPYSLWDWMSLKHALGICAQLRRNLLHSNCHPLGHTGEVNGEAACRGQWGSVIGAKVYILATVASVAVDIKCFLCLQYKSYSVESHIIHTAQHCHFLTAYTVTYFIGGERDKRKLWGNVLFFILYYFFLPKCQDGCHLSSYQTNSVCCFVHYASSLLYMSSKMTHHTWLLLFFKNSIIIKISS